MGRINSRSIMRLLQNSRHPMHVERIRAECGIGNWQTALSRCLELLHEGAIEGTRTSNGWVFSRKSRSAHSRAISSEFLQEHEKTERRT